jgi:hypothetical protein
MIGLSDTGTRRERNDPSSSPKHPMPPPLQRFRKFLLRHLLLVANQNLRPPELHSDRAIVATYLSKQT